MHLAHRAGEAAHHTHVARLLREIMYYYYYYCYYYYCYCYYSGDVCTIIITIIIIIIIVTIPKMYTRTDLPDWCTSMIKRSIACVLFNARLMHKHDYHTHSC